MYMLYCKKQNVFSFLIKRFYNKENSFLYGLYGFLKFESLVIYYDADHYIIKVFR